MMTASTVSDRTRENVRFAVKFTAGLACIVGVTWALLLAERAQDRRRLQEKLAIFEIQPAGNLGLLLTHRATGCQYIERAGFDGPELVPLGAGCAQP